MNINCIPNHRVNITPRIKQLVLICLLLLPILEVGTDLSLTELRPGGLWLY